MALRTKIGNNSITCKGTVRDRFSRFLGTCYLGKLDLNSWMVRNGYALAYRHYSKRYVAAEQEARKVGRGLWAGEFVSPWHWRKGKRLMVGQNSECYKNSVKAPVPLLGNHGEVVVMWDGTIWEIVGGEYEYMYEYYPSVILCPKKRLMTIGNKAFKVVPIAGKCNNC